MKKALRHFVGFVNYAAHTQYSEGVLCDFSDRLIVDELRARGLDISNKVDLIASRWTLRHLVDPMGTVEQLYGLLRPHQGMLLSNGYFFVSPDHTHYGSYIEGFHTTKDAWKVLASGNARALFRVQNSGKSADEFLLVRGDERPLDLPIEYNGLVLSHRLEMQNASHRLTSFEPSPLFHTDQDVIMEARRGHVTEEYYGNPASEELASHLFDRGLFVSDIEKPKKKATVFDAFLESQVLDVLISSNVSGVLMQKDSGGHTLAHHAAKKKNWHALKSLVNYDRSFLKIKVGLGVTPLDLAKRYGAPQSLIEELEALQ